MPTTPAAFLILDDALATARGGAEMVLAGDEGHHAAKVARVRAGEQILLTDAGGRQAPATVREARKESLLLCLDEDPGPPMERSPRLTLVQALATGGRDEQAVESATELGADRIVPWMAERSVAVWKGEKQRKGRARWESTVRAAVKQCRRPGIPAVDPPRSSAELTAEVRDRVAGGALVLALHEQESVALMSLAEELRGAETTAVPEIVVIVGPEGGISPRELVSLRAAGARPVLLGPEVLRSSTAGPAAIAVLSALVGRWSAT